MECPACHDMEAYVGLNSVDCLNPECIHFKEPYLESKLKESKNNFDSIIEALGAGGDLAEILAELWVREVCRPDIPSSGEEVE